jgi:serine phosphatase RsbU (regulator of sigma subunit)
LLERVVAEMGTDLGAVLLMDEDEPVLRIRAAIGLEEEVAEAVTVPVGQGFAGRIAASRQPKVVEDVANYDVVSRYLRERVKSAVGVPLMVDDEVIGVMHTSSTTPRTFDDADVALLMLAAERAALAIRRADLYERQERIASMLQEALTPVELPDIPRLEVSVLYRAAGRGIEAGGDFYDLFQRGRGEWSLVVGDVCGRGTRAAAVTGLVRGAVRALATLHGSPARVLEQANEAMVRSEVERFCTAAYATIRPVKRGVRVRLSRAGHPPPMVLRADGTVEEVYPSGTLIGVFANLTFEEVSMVLGPGDAILLYTDGLVERSQTLDAPGALARELGRAAGRSAAGVVRHLADASGVAAGDEHDDVVILVARVLD